MVSCPICGNSVPSLKINDHIDSNCENFIEEPTSSTGEPGSSHKTPVPSFFQPTSVRKAASQSIPQNDSPSAPSPLRPASANLEINYRAPVYSGNFYTFHSQVDPERSTERKAFVTGEIRDPVGRVCAQASAIFVVPKGFKLRKIGERF